LAAVNSTVISKPSTTPRRVNSLLDGTAAFKGTPRDQGAHHPPSGKNRHRDYSQLRGEPGSAAVLCPSCEGEIRPAARTDALFFAPFTLANDVAAGVDCATARAMTRPDGGIATMRRPSRKPAKTLNFSPRACHRQAASAS
jgi:hypothetical protein